MAMHTLHADIHEEGLQDNCPACLEHAENPWRDLDSRMLSELIRRNHLYRFAGGNDTDKYKPRSINEAIAMANITTLIERAGALLQEDELGYLQDYWESKWRIYFK